MIHLDEAQDRELVRAALLHYACLCRGSEVAAILSDDLEGEALHRERRLRADMLRAALTPPPIPDLDDLRMDDVTDEEAAEFMAALDPDDLDVEEWSRQEERRGDAQREASGW